MGDDIIKYDREHVQNAVCKWKGYVNRYQMSIEDLCNFATFIGHVPGVGDGARIVPVDLPEVRHLIDMINGPHGATIIRMLEIRNADNEGEINK